MFFVANGWAQTSSVCASKFSDWMTSYENLKTTIDSLTEVKRNSVEPLIKQALESKKPGITISQVVQYIVSTRNQTLSKMTSQCLRLAEVEKYAFEQLKRCRGAESKKEDPSLSNLFRERLSKLSELQELILDEAYVQYRRESPNPPAAYSRYDSGRVQNPYAYQNNQNGYGQSRAPYGLQ
jgi:hypothetical protein